MSSSRALGLALVFVAAPAMAGEGMWLPEQLPELGDAMRSDGLALDPDALADLSAAPMGAIVSLGGCSASFVSNEGLVVTNHHCVVGALQLNSTADNNLLETGFSASTRADEVWAGPGSKVYVTEAVDDVTDVVLAALDEAEDDLARWRRHARVTSELVAECEAAGPYMCRVASTGGGASFRLIRQLEIEDVRLVFAPPEMIGFFGGDDDNWMWPRHAGDFAFLRAYVGPDGAPAAHADDNVPYTPTAALEVSREGVDEGDFVMVAGYPGSTNRQVTASEMAWARDVDYPWQIEVMTDMIGILDARSDEDADAAVLLAGMRFGLSNYLKNNHGMLDGFRNSGGIERAQQREAAPLDALADGDARAADDELLGLIEDQHALGERDALLGWMLWSVRLASAAQTGYRLAQEMDKPDDLDRDPGYQERDLDEIRARIERIERSWDRTADEQLFAYWLERADALPAEQRIDVIDDLLEGYRTEDDPYAGMAEDFFGRTVLTDADERMGLIERSTDDYTYSRDPFLQLVVLLDPMLDEIRERDRTFQGAALRLRPHYVAALESAATGPVYPDADSTLRITWGLVQGYPGADGVWYLPQTTVRGVTAKHTGEEPFDAPDELLAAIEQIDDTRWIDTDLGTVPVDFLSTVDTTGGNSGSATLDAHGRLVGLLFDGNYESMASDWVFDPIMTRSIHVDIRYALWLLEDVYHADALLLELGIEPAEAVSR